METTTKKQAIVQSINSMNEAEMEKVIGFIRDLIYSPDQDRDYLEFKRKGLKEIQDALGSAPRAV
ncbi:hypothetical protein [Fulvivirga lutea]|uniref:Uncharacterized protein n=1 Tax=Fulvivirga lutea TaxID=2810512 RepID=A0A974WJA3_9BACT|nr:hypothetical protein [Fulvivirga lutea]QSE98177.1 hypothetical protein JR347_03605 [Fulvivirga lutea]